MKRNVLPLLLLALSSLLHALSMEGDRASFEITGVIGSTMSVWADLNYTDEYAFFLNEGLDNDKSEYLVRSSDHGLQIGTWGMVSNYANTTLTITHDKLMPREGGGYEGIEYRLYIQYPEPDDGSRISRTYCYSSAGPYPSSFSRIYNTAGSLTSFGRMGLYVQLDLDSLAELDVLAAPSGAYLSTITLSVMAQ